MRHDQPQLIDALASEVRIGHAARCGTAPIRALALGSWHIASRVQTWEGRLIPLALGLPPLAPAPEVWRAIEERIRIAEASRPVPARRAAMRALAAAVVVCVIVAGGFFAWRMTLPLQLQPVATIKAAQGPGVWSIETDARGERLRAVALAGASCAPWAFV